MGDFDLILFYLIKYDLNPQISKCFTFPLKKSVIYFTFQARSFFKAHRIKVLSLSSIVDLFYLWNMRHFVSSYVKNFNRVQTSKQRGGGGGGTELVDITSLPRLSRLICNEETSQQNQVNVITINLSFQLQYNDIFSLRTKTCLIIISHQYNIIINLSRLNVRYIILVKHLKDSFPIVVRRNYNPTSTW